jgi:hypothetical protein
VRPPSWFDYPAARISPEPFQRSLLGPQTYSAGARRLFRTIHGPEFGTTLAPQSIQMSGSASESGPAYSISTHGWTGVAGRAWHVAGGQRSAVSDSRDDADPDVVVPAVRPGNGALARGKRVCRFVLDDQVARCILTNRDEVDVASSKRRREIVKHAVCPSTSPLAWPAA